MSSEWCTIESDPAVFSEIIHGFGVQGTEVIELWDMDVKSIEKHKPVYGLIFLFKWEKKHEVNDARPIDNDADDVFFAKQVVTNACGTQAILSVLLNRPDVALGKALTDFREFAMSVPPEIRGEMIGNDALIRSVHNSFARPEPLFDEKDDKDEEGEAFHFVAYVPVNGRLYELDGLKPGPIKLGECTLDTFVEKAAPAIQERIKKYSEKEIRFTLLGIVKDRKEDLRARVTSLTQREQQIRAKLDGAGASAMETDDDLPSGEALQHMLVSVQEDRKDVEAELKEEERRAAKAKVENVRRKHDYVPFVFALVQTLAKNGKLQGLVEAGEKTRADQLRRMRENQAKETAAKAATSAAPKAPTGSAPKS